MTNANAAPKRYHLKHRGPGGRDCPCCAPAPGKARKAERRSAKRSERNDWKKENA